MSTADFLILFIGVAIPIALFRVAPIFVLKGRQLPASVTRALGFIPPAAFAALVANDLFDPAKLASGSLRDWAAPLVAAAITGAAGTKTKSLAWCIVVGVASLAVLQALPF